MWDLMFIDTEVPLSNDEQWIYVDYLKSNCELTVLTTTAVGSVRPKIHHLHKLIVKHCQNYRKGYYEKLFDELSIEDQVNYIGWLFFFFLVFFLL